MAMKKRQKAFVTTDVNWETMTKKAKAKAKLKVKTVDVKMVNVAPGLDLRKVVGP